MAVPWCATWSRSVRTARGIGLARSRLSPTAHMQGLRGSASRRTCWTVSMLDVAAALCAGLGVTAAMLAVAVPPPAPLDEAPAPSWLHRYLSKRWKDEQALAAGAGRTAHRAARLAAFPAAVAPSLSRAA